MLKVQACIFSLLLVSGAALAQEGDKAPENDPAQAEQAEAQQSNADAEGMNQEQKSKEKKKAEEDQAEENQADQSSADSTASSDMFMAKQAEDQIRSDQLVGSNIVNASDDKIGSISDLIMDQEGQVVGIVVGVGGFLGMGEKQVALSWDAVEIAPAEDDASYQVKTSIDKEDLDNAEPYKTEEKQQQEQQEQKQKEQQQQQTQDPAQE
ncbi:PRC-barrel domain-containing protein [Halomonas garicola]|uniref:PRC-barrel domain-containing protein n=1 Tax=Halomonas garicola TaxID=1690008 RepID=UPI00289DF3BC|nr:PRC-barrel domain-containing protein [Halomonas garicola]